MIPQPESAGHNAYPLLLAADVLLPAVLCPQCGNEHINIRATDNNEIVTLRIQCETGHTTELGLVRYRGHTWVDRKDAP